MYLRAQNTRHWTFEFQIRNIEAQVYWFVASVWLGSRCIRLEVGPDECSSFRWSFRAAGRLRCTPVDWMRLRREGMRMERRFSGDSKESYWRTPPRRAARLSSAAGIRAPWETPLPRDNPRASPTSPVSPSRTDPSNLRKEYRPKDLRIVAFRLSRNAYQQTERWPCADCQFCFRECQEPKLRRTPIRRPT